MFLADVLVVMTTISARKKRSRIWVISKEELQQIVQRCRFFGDVLLELGYENKGGSPRILKQRLEQDGIDCSHFKANFEAMKRERKSFSWDRQVSNEEMFRLGSDHSSATLKHRIQKDNLKEYRCKNCQNTGEWQGQRLSLQLDHENGDGQDNRLENLRFLCPNCHSQTPTFSGKKHRRNPLPKSGEELAQIRRKNGQESGFNQRKVKDRPTIESLKKQVEDNGYEGVGRVYGVSGNTIRKWMKFDSASVLKG